MLQINNLTIPIGGDETLLRQKAAKILGVRPAEFLSFSLQRQSIDARKKDDVHLVCAVRATHLTHCPPYAGPPPCPRW